ncbi:hypothetical protein WMF31_12910 [Sorangium sp. So ce1036]|uniref:hypothetical protein n=1 Tax=Sorangium sp. So ce1036 TaxID=3133328 RepID=UPI003F12028B
MTEHFSMRLGPWKATSCVDIQVAGALVRTARAAPFARDEPRGAVAAADIDGDHVIRRPFP